MTRNVLSMCYIQPNKLGTFEAFMLKLTEALQARGCRHVIVFQESPPDWLARRFTDSGASLESVDFSRNGIRELAALLRLFRKYRPGLSYWHFFSYWSPCLLLGTFFAGRHVFIDHISGPGRCRRPLWLDMAIDLGNVWFILRRIRFVGVSHFVRKRMIHSRRLRERMTTCIWNGVPAASPDVPGAEQDIRQELGIPDDTFLICSTAYLRREKALDTAITALPQVLDSFPQMLWLVMGDGPERVPLMELSEKLGVSGNVRFLGQRNDVQRILRGCDLFVLVPRWQEAFAYVFLEAQVCGLPVVASRVGGNPEAVLDGDTGLIVESESPDELAEAITSLMADPEKLKQMGIRAAQRARELFTLDRMVQEYIELGLDRKR